MPYRNRGSGKISARQKAGTGRNQRERSRTIGRANNPNGRNGKDKPKVSSKFPGQSEIPKTIKTGKQLTHARHNGIKRKKVPTASISLAAQKPNPSDKI